MSKRLLTSFGLAGALLALAACSDAPEEEADSGAEAENAETAPEGAPEGPEGEPEMPEPDVSDIPDVVAEVNGEEISGEDFTDLYETQFQQMAMQAQMTGEELDQDELKEQTAENMVGNELLMQDAEGSGFEAGGDDVEALLEETAEMNGMESVDELIAAYEEQGMSEEQLREDAEAQVLIDQVVEELDVEEPSEDELQELYDQQMEGQPAPQEGEDGEEPEQPSFDEVRDELEEQATTQKENEAAAAHVEDLREDADVEINL